ncbi:hypothetical protein QA943_02145 [Streptomyces sp. B21-097]|uniref:hypothetical protein n=1 Tax=Streptomyces sp. B21-097 TaxID=3039414 RepID=UPI002FEFE4CD
MAARELELEPFERDAELYARLGDVCGEGEAVLRVGVFRRVVPADAEPHRPAPAFTLIPLQRRLMGMLRYSHSRCNEIYAWACEFGVHLR